MGKRSGQTQRRYTPELRERAVRMVREAIAQNNNRSHGVLTRVSVDLGVGSETLRGWVKRADVDAGRRPGITTDERQRLLELEKENRELRQANVRGDLLCQWSRHRCGVNPISRVSRKTRAVQWSAFRAVLDSFQASVVARWTVLERQEALGLLHEPTTWRSLDATAFPPT